ncbi:MAG: hypothetical protein ACYDIC_06735 [Desulfobaccales bacterium]
MLQRSVSLVVGLLLSLLAVNPAPAQDGAELGRIFDAYNAGAKAGDVDKMLSLRTTKMDQEIRGQIVKKEDRKFFVAMGRAQIPESYQIQHVSWGKDRQSASLYLLAQYAALPEMERPRTRMEGLITFKKEKGAWKIDSILALGDPDKVKRPKDMTYDPKDTNLNATGEIAGRIVKTDFKPGYTLVILRVMDEENAVFLPPKEVLEKSGVPLADLDPWKMQKFGGHPHKSDKLKFFATRGEPMED